MIGKPHQDSERAVKNLEAEGFTFSEHGGHLRRRAGAELPARRDPHGPRRAGAATVAAIADEVARCAEYMIGTTADSFRACKGPVEMRPDARAS